MRRIGMLSAIAVSLLAGAIAPALASPREPPLSPEALCQKLGTDDRLRPIPDSLVPAAIRLFYMHTVPAVWVRRTTYFRCFERHVMICNLGANLPCGKADTSRHLPAADRWCAEHPGSDFIPFYVTGHDTIYRWRCAGKKAAAGGSARAVDRRGFVARYWKRVDPGG